MVERPQSIVVGDRLVLNNHLSGQWCWVVVEEIARKTFLSGSYPHALCRWPDGVKDWVPTGDLDLEPEPDNTGEWTGPDDGAWAS